MHHYGFTIETGIIAGNSAVVCLVSIAEPDFPNSRCWNHNFLFARYNQLFRHHINGQVLSVARLIVAHISHIKMRGILAHGFPIFIVNTFQYDGLLNVALRIAYIQMRWMAAIVQHQQLLAFRPVLYRTYFFEFVIQCSHFFRTIPRSRLCL